MPIARLVPIKARIPHELPSRRRGFGMLSLLLALLIAANTGLAESRSPLREPGTIELRLAVSEPSQWIPRLVAVSRLHPKGGQVVGTLGMGSVGAAVYRVDLSKPVRAVAVYPEPQPGTEPAKQPESFAVHLGTTHRRSFEQRRVNPSEPGRLFREGGGPLGEGEIGFAACDGKFAYLTDRLDRATRDGMAAFVRQQANVRSPFVGPSFEQSDAKSEIRLAIDFAGLSDAARTRVSDAITSGLKKAAREQQASDKSMIEKRLGLETLRAIQQFALPIASLQDAAIAVSLDDESRCRVDFATGWEGEDDTVAAIAEMSPQPSDFAMISRDAAVLQADLHLMLTERTATRLSRLVELVADQVRAEARRKDTIDYIDRGLGEIESELFDTLSDRHLNSSLAVIAAENRAGLVCGLRCRDASAIDGAVRAFLHRVGTKPTEEVVVANVAWFRMPSDEKSAQPFWIGHDQTRLWMLVGSPRPTDVLVETSRSARIPDVDDAPPASWFDLNVYLNRLASSRAALKSIDIDVPDNPILQNLSEGDVVEFRVFPTAMGMQSRLDLPGSLMRQLVAQIESTK